MSEVSIKECFRCGAAKPLTDFYKHSQMGDGHLNKCKECTKSDMRRYRRRKIDYYRQYDRERSMLPHRVAARAEYAQTPEGKEAHARAKRRWTSENPDKRKANCAVNNAVRDGRLHKPNACQICGTGGRIHGHHDDYSKPLEVRWVCPACHTAIHKGLIE